MSSPKLSKAYDKYGASMGRMSYKTDNDSQRFYLHRVYLDNGGYDNGGAYWGHDKPLYRYLSEDGEGEGFLRAYNREDAKEQVREIYENAKFFN